MIQAIRDKVQGIVAWLIVGVLILMFAMWGIGNYLTGSAPGQMPVAKVDGAAITQTEWQLAYQQAEHRLKMPEDMTAQQQQLLRESALDGLINRQLLYNNAKRAGVSVTKQQVDKLLISDPNLQVDGQFSMAHLQVILQNIGMNIEQFQAYLATDMMINQQQQGILLSQFVLPQEIAHYAALLDQQRDFGYMMVASQKYVKPEQITAAQIKTYYQQHQQDYMLPASMQLNYLLLNYADVEKTIHITDQQAENYYQQNKADFKDHEKLRAFAAVKSEIVTQLKREQAQQQYTQLGNEMANITFENPSSLDQAAKQLELTIHSTSTFTKTTGHAGIVDNADVLQAAFGYNVLQQRNNSDVINLSSKKALVIRVKNYQPAHPKPLDDVSEQIRLQLAHIQANQAAHQQAQKLLVAIQQDNPTTVAEHHEMTWHTENKVRRDDQSLDSQLLQHVFNTPMPGKKPVNIIAPLNDGDYAVVQISQAQLDTAQTAAEKQHNTAELTLYSLARARDVLDSLQFLHGKADIHKLSLPSSV